MLDENDTVIHTERASGFEDESHYGSALATLNLLSNCVKLIC